MKRINIILDHNLDGSITRIAVMYANHLSVNGYDVIVNYPVFSRYRCYLFKGNSPYSIRFLLLLVKAFIKGLIRKKKWIGAINYKLTKEVKLNNYLYKPTRFNILDADYILIFQNQLLFQKI